MLSYIESIKGKEFGVGQNFSELEYNYITNILIIRDMIICQAKWSIR